MNISLPKKILFFSVVLILFIFVGYLIFSLTTSIKTSPENGLAQPTPFPNANAQQQMEYPRTRSIPFKIMGIEPPEDKTGKNNYSPIKDIAVTFNKEINPKKVLISVTPSIVLEARMGKNGQEILISPPAPSFWKPGVLYTVVINQQTEALDGTVLVKDFTYSIMTKLDPGGE